uniref:Transport and Golgi organization protein 2 n=1 Tax=Cacopsylla melanoneura TaxID=428564 RepID=A0A8D8PUX8_9HEMI
MCITFIYCNDNPPDNGYKLVIASNRDEEYRRETKHLHHWPNRNIIGGQDAVKGGTWLAASSNGKIGVLLNVLGENSRPNAKDRGPIVVAYVGGNRPAEEYLQSLKKATEEQVYNGFHSVLVELTLKNSSIYHYCNVSPTPKITKLTDSKPNTSEETHIYGFGNSQCLSTPFEKVKFGKRKFAEIMQKHNKQSETQTLIETILDLMKNKQKNYPDVEIDRKAEPGMDLEYKMKYSALYVDMSSRLYGTRTHSIILIDQNNVMDFHEWTMDDWETQEWKHTHIHEQMKLT